MAKRILLIDSDEAFAQALSTAMVGRGFAARATTDSEEGMELARTENPDLIVVCVEAQPTNGYMVCTRLKKDDQLKTIPLVLTSSTATPDAFEKHSKLKTRAEEYLIKPFAPQVLVEKASALLRSLSAPDAEEEEILAVSDKSVRLSDLVDVDGPIPLSEQDAAEAHVAEETVVVEEVEDLPLEELPEAHVEPAHEEPEAPARTAHDDDLQMFDQAFDSVAAGPAPASAKERGRAKAGAVEPRPKEASQEVDIEQEMPLEREITAPDDDAVLSGLIDEPVPPRPAPRAAPTAPAPAKRAAEPPRGNSVDREIQALRGEVSALAGERDRLVEERDQLRRQLEELQDASQRNENRAVKAYKQLKDGEKLRDKARQALQIALRLLEEQGGDDDEVPAIKSA